MNRPAKIRPVRQALIVTMLALSGCGLFESLEAPEGGEQEVGFDYDAAAKGIDADINQGDDLDADDGERCPANNYVRSGECARCPTGTRRSAGDDPAAGDTVCEPILCGEDQRVLSNQCIACVRGTRRDEGDDATGQDTVCTPILCGEDERVEDRACVACGQDEFNLEGDDASGPPTTCDASSCPSNKRVSDNQCVACAPGTRRLAGDDPAGPDTMCDALLCAQNERVVQNQCSACGPGGENAEGDDASGADTTCDPVLCLEDERVDSNQCVECPLGETNAAGDQATGPDTSCEVEPCLEDEYVLMGVCTPCRPGSTNASGDDPTLISTQCDPTLCQENERVSSNQCVACATGWVNEAGDDATGMDTVCVEDPCFTVYGILCDDITYDYVKASNTDASDGFGTSVAMHGDLLAVGAVGESSRATGVNGNERDDASASSGAVYVFQLRGTTWSQVAYLKASNSDAGDRFGASIALHEGLLVVGAPGEASSILGSPGDDGAPSAGAAYVFGSLAGSWSELAYLKAAVPGENDRFGEAVAIHAGRVAVGAPNEDSSSSTIDGDQGDDSLAESGAVYVFDQTGPSSWGLRSYVKAPNAGEGDLFGASVALHDRALAIGAPGESSRAGIDGDMTDDTAANAGAVYVFFEDAAGWKKNGYVKASNTGEGDRFGTSIGLDALTLVVGAPGEASSIPFKPADDSAPDAGAVYVLTRFNASWTHRQFIKASNTGEGDRFGEAVALYDDLVAAGAPGEDSRAQGVGGSGSSDSMIDAGAGYLFRLTRTSWREVAYVKASNSGEGDEFGRDVALGPGVFLFGAPKESSSSERLNGDQSRDDAPGAGAAYLGPARP